MKITIKKFMELSNVSFETPVKIEAGHDVGKSTIFRSVLFAITGKDVDGKEFDGRIYPKKSVIVSDLNVEVEIEQSGVVFCKSAKGTEKRQKGSDEIELQRSVTATYMLDYRVVGKGEYDAKINEVFGNFHLFCNPDYFRNLKKDEKRAIFANLVQIDKDSYFDGLQDKTTVKGRIKEQTDLIAYRDAALSEFKKIQEPEKIEVENFDEKLSELRKQRQDAAPKLTEKQIEENNEINRKIHELKTSFFVPEKLIPTIADPEKPVLFNISNLKKEIEIKQASEPDTDIFDLRIEQFIKKIEKIRSITNQIENYNDNVKNAKCVVCQVCTNPDCQFKKIQITPIEDLKTELSKYMSLTDAEKSLEKLENEKINHLRNFEHEKAEEIERLADILENRASLNGSMIEKYELEKAETDKKNQEISAKNLKIKTANLENFAKFDSEQSEKIEALLSKIHKPANFDYSEIDEKIKELELAIYDQRALIDQYNKKQGAYENACRTIANLTEELKNLKNQLYDFERELIKIEDAENRYYSDFENSINSEMPENIRVSLFKKNLSNDNYSEVFEIEFDGSIYAGNGKTIAFYIWLCGWFQSKFRKDLPIFIDEAIILNESLYSNVKNAVILMRNDNCKTLKISEIK